MISPRQLLQLSFNDLRQIFREQMLWGILLVAPLAQFSLARLFIPWLEARLPVIQNFHLLIVMLMTLQIVAGIGFVVASIVLDEKDEQVLTVIRTLPIGAGAFLLYRLLTAVGVSFLFSFVMLTGTGLVFFPASYALGGALLFALAAPLVMLFIASFARNKVEGAALFKVINLLLFLPAIGLFLSSPVRFLFSPIPTFWTMHFLNLAREGAAGWMNFIVSLLFHVAFIFFSYQLLRKNIFN